MSQVSGGWIINYSTEHVWSTESRYEKCLYWQVTAEATVSNAMHETRLSPADAGAKHHENVELIAAVAALT